MERIVTERRHREEGLRPHAQDAEDPSIARESEERLRLAVAGSNDGLWDWDLLTDAFYVCDRWTQMIGLPAQARVERVDDWFRYVHTSDLPALRGAIDRHLAGETVRLQHEYRTDHRDGAPRWMLCRGVAVRDDSSRPVRIAGLQTDITEQQRINNELAHAALHDSLTGLANRALFTELLEHAVSKAKRSPACCCAVLFVDVDHFKQINDSFGHLVGDRLLGAIGRRFLGQLRPGDVLARLGGDEFAVLLEDITHSGIATALADRLEAALHKPFEIGGRVIHAAASVGIGLSGNPSRSSDDLLREADTEMYRIKALRRTSCHLTSR
jgi:diguanylate cyclase (GGDEF)-like protein/PAS domain S-box-containing protein